MDYHTATDGDMSEYDYNYDYDVVYIDDKQMKGEDILTVDDEGSSIELMEEIEKINENGAELDRKEIKVSWNLK